MAGDNGSDRTQNVVRTQVVKCKGGRFERLATCASVAQGRTSLDEVVVIDRINRAAKALIWLRMPALVMALVCFVLVVVLLLASESREGDRYLIPGALGLLWFLSAYSFIELFRSVPAKARVGQGLFERLRRHAARALCWLLVALFVCITAGLLFLTNRLVQVWLEELAN